jgi:hypothetical protein
VSGWIDRRKEIPISQTMPIGKITPSMLNAMSVEDRVTALNELFPQMDIWAAHHVSYFCWNRRTLIRTTAMSNGSCFFIGFLDRLFLVTAAHVYDGYMADKVKSEKMNIVCHIENIVFDPEARLAATTAILILLPSSFPTMIY